MIHTAPSSSTGTAHRVCLELATGSAGAQTFPAFRRFIIDVAATRILALLNISVMGMLYEQVGELLDLIRRMRVEYSLDESALLAKVRTSIPAATAKEGARWAKEGEVRWRMIDGKKFYFRREPQNIFLFNAEATVRATRAGHQPKVDSRSALNDHLKAILRSTEDEG